MDGYTPQRVVMVGALLLCFTGAASAQIGQQNSPTTILPPALAQGQRETGTLASTAPFQPMPFAVSPVDSQLLTTPQVNQFSPNQPFVMKLRPGGNPTSQAATNASVVRSLWDTPGADNWLASTPKNTPSVLSGARTQGLLAHPAGTPAVNWQQPPALTPSFSSSPAPAQNWNTPTDAQTKGIKYQWQ